MDLMISGKFLEFLSGLFTKIFMYRFPCISGLKSKKGEFQREKKQAYSIFYGEFKSSAKKILVLGEDGQNRKKHPIAKEHAIFRRKWLFFLLLIIFLDFLI